MHERFRASSGRAYDLGRYGNGGLTIERAIHDRYHASKRNPWNEVECGDHYARSMASYGVFLAACGFEYKGPEGRIGFAPRLTPERFKAAFTTAEGWGSYYQKIDNNKMTVLLSLKWGSLRLKTISLGLAKDLKFREAKVRLDQVDIASEVEFADEHAIITLKHDLNLTAEKDLEIIIS